MKIINYVHIFNKWAKTKMVATLISSSPPPISNSAAEEKDCYSRNASMQRGLHLAGTRTQESNSPLNSLDSQTVGLSVIK